MKVLTLKLGEKTYTTGKITAYMTRKSFELSRKAIEFGKMGQQISSAADLDTAEKLMKELEDFTMEKYAYICEVYGNKFTVDELEKELSMEEINEQINMITKRITGVLEKN